MKSRLKVKKLLIMHVAPVRERGLKLSRNTSLQGRRKVAPVRERGLKYEAKLHSQNCFSRSRKGAWIEIHFVV